MAVFEYQGVNSKGRSVRGIVDAESPRAARAKLRRDGIFTSELTEETKDAVTGGLNQRLRLRTLFERVGVMEVSIVARQLSTLLGAGTPLVTALNAILEQQTKETMRKALTQVRENVNEGVSLADALAKHPKVFPELFTDMVGSGEASGALDIVLVRVADYMEEHARNVAKVRAVMTYPILMLFVAGAIVFLIFTQAVPRLRVLFEGMGKALPPTTRALIAIGDFLGSYWWILAALMVGALFAFQRYGKTDSGRLRIDGWKLKVPVAGELLLKVAVARFARTLSTLLASGIPILKALDIVHNVVANRVLGDAINEARTSVEAGASLSGPLRAAGIFPPILIHMVSVGEQSGELEAMLSKVADGYDGEVETSMLKLTSLMEPMIVLFMAGIVVFIALAILQPILQLNSIATT